jgi:hypothetical protein
MNLRAAREWPESVPRRQSPNFHNQAAPTPLSAIGRFAQTKINRRAKTKQSLLGCCAQSLPFLGSVAEAARGAALSFLDGP